MGLISNLNNYAQSILKDIQGWKEDLADAITSKDGEADADASFNQIISDVSTIPNFSLGGCVFAGSEPKNLVESFLAKNYLTEVIDESVEVITNYQAFGNLTLLEHIEFKALTTLSGDYAFAFDSALKEVILPSLVYISSKYPFTGSTSLLDVLEVPNVEVISGEYVFGNLNISSLSLPKLREITGRYTFMQQTGISNLNLPSLTTIQADGTFQSATGFYRIILPLLIANNYNDTFNGCTGLEYVFMPSVTNWMGQNAFKGCTNLFYVQFGTLANMSREPFGDFKKNLEEVIVGEGTDCDLDFGYWTANNVTNSTPGRQRINTKFKKNIIDKLRDVSNTGITRTIYLGWYSYLSDENIQALTAKGWSVA